MRFLPVLLAIAALSSPPARAADDPGAAAFAQRVNVEIPETGLRAALDRFLAGSHLSYSVDPNVLNVPVRLKLQDVKRETALAVIARIVRVVVPGVYCNREGANVALWIDSTRPEAPPVEMKPDARLDKKLSLDLKEAPLRKAVEALAAETGVQFVVLPNVLNAPVTLTENDQPAADAIHALIQQLSKVYDGGAAAYCEPEGEVYVIGLRRAKS